MNFSSEPLAVLQQEVIACRQCPRLVEYIAEIGRVKRRAYRDWDYWAKPVPSFGDPAARVLILGLAPGAHGSNRTGRPFTGDGSGATLYRVLYRAGFASLPESKTRDDELRLLDAYITAAVHCAPPGNKPAREEIANCRPYAERELALLSNLRVVVALGRIAFDVYLSILKDRGIGGHVLVAGEGDTPAAPGAGRQPRLPPADPRDMLDDGPRPRIGEHR